MGGVPGGRLAVHASLGPELTRPRLRRDNLDRVLRGAELAAARAKSPLRAVRHSGPRQLRRQRASVRTHASAAPPGEPAARGTPRAPLPTRAPPPPPAPRAATRSPRSAASAHSTTVPARTPRSQLSVSTSSRRANTVRPSARRVLRVRARVAGAHRPRSPRSRATSSATRATPAPTSSIAPSASSRSTPYPARTSARSRRASEPPREQGRGLVPPRAGLASSSGSPPMSRHGACRPRERWLVPRGHGRR